MIVECGGWERTFSMAEGFHALSRAFQVHSSGNSNGTMPPKLGLLQIIDIIPNHHKVAALVFLRKP